MYSEKDFSGCMFNPLNKKRILDAYPSLSELIPAEERPPTELTGKKLRFIIAMYDPNSPLIKNIPDLTIRKQSAAVLAGFDLRKDEELLNELFTFSDEGFAYSVDKFLQKFTYARLWAMICSMEQTWWEWNSRLMKPVKAEKDKEELQSIQIKSIIADEMDKLHTRLEGYYQRFYFEDSDLLEAAKKIQRITPESIARGN